MCSKTRIGPKTVPCGTLESTVIKNCLQQRSQEDI